MPPGGKLKSIYSDFSAVLKLIAIKTEGIGCSMTMHDVTKFQRDLNIPTRYIYNFTEIVRFNEMGIKNILLSVPMKSKPNPHHAAASPPPECLTGWLAGEKAGWLAGWIGGWMDGWVE